jgi:hypothetical protein
MSSRRNTRKPRPTDPEFWTVINELTNPLPVSKAELDAIERYFADVIAQSLKPVNGRAKHQGDNHD